MILHCVCYSPKNFASYPATSTSILMASSAKGSMICLIFKSEEDEEDNKPRESDWESFKIEFEEEENEFNFTSSFEFDCEEEGEIDSLALKAEQTSPKTVLQISICSS